MLTACLMLHLPPLPSSPLRKSYISESADFQMQIKSNILFTHSSTNHLRKFFSKMKLIIDLAFCLLLLLVPVYAQPRDVASWDQSEPEATIPVTPVDLDTDEPQLWQMAAFAARQMSSKQNRFKLQTLDAAEQIESLYRLRVTLQRMSMDSRMNTNDVLYCTVGVRTDEQGQQWEIENFGCTQPAMIRRRRPQQKKPIETPSIEMQPIEKPKTIERKYEKPIDNTISDTLEDETSVNNIAKRDIVSNVPNRNYYYNFPRFVPAYPQYQIYYY